MQTNFSPRQLADPATQESERVLRACVHCGFCTATCPTYVLLGDELDSPRGRIYLMKHMLENDLPADAETVKHIDRCLGCLSCMTTCPSGVNYMHLVDHARHHIERTYRRPLGDRLLRRMLGAMLPRPWLFRAGLHGARLGKPAAGLFGQRLRAMLAMAPAKIPRAGRDAPQTFPAQGERIARVGLLTGCAQRVLAPSINAATVALLTRHGCEVVIARGAGCCGALTDHLGQDAHGFARANIDAWSRAELDAVIINTSGCGTTVKEYGFSFRSDPAYAEAAAKISAMTFDITEWMAKIGLRTPVVTTGQRVAYHSACSLLHGQRVREEPRALLRAAGFEVADIPESHLCCGSAGTYNLMQPEIATSLRDRKVANIETTRPDIVAAGNIGCLQQIAQGTGVPVVHTVELLDWATGGNKPESLQRHGMEPRPDRESPIAAGPSLPH